MPSFDIVKEVKPQNTFRVSNIVSNFDLDVEHIHEHFSGNIDIEGAAWNVGLIVGGSGTGKSTIARECFPDAYATSVYKYNAAAVIDDMPKGKTIKEIELAFTSVGFASPPSWLKPYDVLSNGEKMRVDLARNILDDKDVIIFDEFTSVVNREVAKTSSYAISKAVRKQNKKFIAVSCHSDVIEWLEPDWIYNTDEKRFFIARESTTAQKSKLKYTGLTTQLKSKFGKSFGSIII
jgi:ABC-type ATPase with predicted acetyltransferase domain